MVTYDISVLLMVAYDISAHLMVAYDMCPFAGDIWH